MISPVSNISFKGCVNIGSNVKDREEIAKSLYAVGSDMKNESVSDYITSKLSELKEDFESTTLPSQEVDILLKYSKSYKETRLGYEFPPRIDILVRGTNNNDDEYEKISADLGKSQELGTGASCIYSEKELTKAIDTLFDKARDRAYECCGIYTDHDIKTNKQIKDIFDKLA